MSAPDMARPAVMLKILAELSFGDTLFTATEVRAEGAARIGVVDLHFVERFLAALERGSLDPGLAGEHGMGHHAVPGR